MLFDVFYSILLSRLSKKYMNVIQIYSLGETVNVNLSNLPVLKIVNFDHLLCFKII